MGYRRERVTILRAVHVCLGILFGRLKPFCFSFRTLGCFMTFFLSASYWELPSSLPPLASFYCCSFSYEYRRHLLCSSCILRISAIPVALPLFVFEYSKSTYWFEAMVCIANPKQLHTCTQEFLHCSQKDRNWSFEITFDVSYDVCL